MSIHRFLVKNTGIGVAAFSLIFATLACSKSNKSGDSVHTDDQRPQTVTPVNKKMTYSLNNGNLIIYNYNGQQVGQASDVVRMIEKPSEHFVAYETRSNNSRQVQKIIFHNEKGLVARCERNCSIQLKDNFAAFVISNSHSKARMAAGLINRLGETHYFAANMRDGNLKQVNLKLTNQFALVSHRGRIHLFKKDGSSQRVRSQCLRNNHPNQCIKITSHFAAINKASRNYPDYEIIHSDTGLLTPSCNGCVAHNANKTNEITKNGVIVGQKRILMSHNFILIPTQNGQAVLYDRNGQALETALAGTRVKMNHIFAGFSSPTKTALYHYRQSQPLHAIGGFSRSFIRIRNNKAVIGVRGQGRLEFDNNGNRIN